MQEYFRKALFMFYLWKLNILTKEKNVIMETLQAASTALWTEDSLAKESSILFLTAQTSVEMDCG